MSDRFRSAYFDTAPDRGHLEVEVVEIPLLLPGWQASALETAAHARGLTAAEMVRYLLRDFIARLPQGQTEPVLLRRDNLEHL